MCSSITRTSSTSLLCIDISNILHTFFFPEFEMLNENLLTSLILSINIRNWTCSIRTSFKQFFFLRFLFWGIYLKIKFIPGFRLYVIRNIFFSSGTNSLSQKFMYIWNTSPPPFWCIPANGTSLYCLQINIYFCTRCIVHCLCAKGKKTNLNFYPKQ